MNLSLEELGLDSFFAGSAAERMEPGLIIGRIAAENRSGYDIWTEAGSCAARISGRFNYLAEHPGQYPAVGDWVLVRQQDHQKLAIISSLLPRRSLLQRKEAGKNQKAQLIAANMDVICIVQGLDHNFNLARLERFLAVARESGAEAAVLLSKSDLCSEEERQQRLAAVAEAAPQVPILAYSALADQDVEHILSLFEKGKTFCLIGSSGVGKSTLINRLLNNELLATQPVREDDSRGRHTTSRRQMIVLGNGAILMDTPGMRELGLWDVDEGVDAAFPEIDALASACRFADCTHLHEPGCAVREAVEKGEVEQRRYDSYLKLWREARHQMLQADERGRQQKKKQDKSLAKEIRRFFREQR